jgi:hypothetical protein
MRSPGIGAEGQELLRQRGALPVVHGKHACHSELTPEAEAAQALQQAVTAHPD